MKNTASWFSGGSFFAILFLLLFSLNSFATLGGTEDSVEADRRVFSGQHKSTVMKKYTLHEISMPGRSIKEYVSPSGVVYGVSWRGMNHPDLSVLFGSYYSEYQAAAQNIPKTKGRGHRSVESERMVVKMSGHMRDVKGQAYIPQLLPAGVTAEDIQ